MIGLVHLTTLEACSQTQIQYIAYQLSHQPSPVNATADELFATDIVYYPMIYGIWSLVYGVVYGAFFALAYRKLPGSTSKAKGVILGLPVFLIGLFAGPAFFSYQCNPSYIPDISLAAGLPISLAFGYILGVFYDSFGRLHKEESEAKEEGEGRRP